MGQLGLLWRATCKFWGKKEKFTLEDLKAAACSQAEYEGLLFDVLVLGLAVWYKPGEPEHEEAAEHIHTRYR